MVTKYRKKKERYGQAEISKMNKENQVSAQKNKLDLLRDKIHILENQLKVLGIQDSDDANEQYQKFFENIKTAKQYLQECKGNSDKLLEKIHDDCMPLEQVEMKVVKTLKIDEIIAMLEKLQIEPIEKEIEKFEQFVKQIEKEIESFTNKTRNKQLAESEQRLKQVEDNVKALERLLKSVGEENLNLKKEVEATTKIKKVSNLADL